MTMYREPLACICSSSHRYHCGDCGSPARIVKRVGVHAGRVVVCLNLAECGRQWEMEMRRAA